MVQRNSFVIRNDYATAVVLNVEPEGVFVPLASGEEVLVTDNFAVAPVTVKLCRSERGDPVLSIWPGDGDVRVEKGGIDVFDLVPSEAAPPQASTPPNQASHMTRPAVLVSETL